MTREEAESLERFVKDHDTRFLATTSENGGAWCVLLTRPEDGAPMEPVRSVAEYGARHVESSSPGPTIAAAWERFREAHS